MNIKIYTGEAYPVHFLNKTILGDNYEVDEETFLRWKSAFVEFEKVQDEIYKVIGASWSSEEFIDHDFLCHEELEYLGYNTVEEDTDELVCGCCCSCLDDQSIDVDLSELNE